MVATAQERIKQDVVDELAWDNRVDANNVKVEVSDGTVTLNGAVPSHFARWSAIDDAWMIPGVQEVNDKLAVEYAEAVTIPTDADIQSNVERALHWNPVVDSSKMSVLVQNGVVKLEGTADSYWQKWRAQDVALNIVGVIRVENQLVVVPTESIADERIAEDVAAALRRRKFVDPDMITVKVEQGVVTLTGDVPSRAAKNAAHNAALFTPGVVGVDDDVAILP